MPSQANKKPIAVVGAGIIGCAVAWTLTREGHPVLLIDRHEPGRAGASFGNVGHIAAELVEPVPSLQLLFGFWRELFALGGPLSVSVRGLPEFLPWARRFAIAAFRRAENTQYLEPLVKPAAAAFNRLLREIGHQDLLRRNGHYQFWTRPGAASRARAERLHMEHLGISTDSVRTEVLKAVAAAAAASARQISGLWFPESAHVVDPFETCQALVRAAIRRGAVLQRAEVRAMSPRGDDIELVTDDGTLAVSGVVVCARPWSAPLLRAFGLHAPLQAARGYHVELPGHPSHVDAPALYVDHRVLVTPMAGRLRASSFMEFDLADAPPDMRKPMRLRRLLQQLGYRVDSDGPSWLGARPVLPGSP